MKKLCVIEINEVPLRVWQSYSRYFPNSEIASLFANEKVFETVADDVDPEDLYPSQTWASLNMGLPYADHRIHWYNDAKGLESFWWRQAAAAGLRVGLVNVLHSYAGGEAGKEDLMRYDYLIPDCFARDAETHPPSYGSFQSFNIKLTQRNGRKTSLGVGDVASMVGKAITHPNQFGLSRFTALELLKALPKIAVARERLRNMQFPPLASIFLDQLQQKDPDVAVLFTNHIAAAQHRYWYALFPSDYSAPLYDEDWVEKYKGEILDAIGMLDRYIARLKRFCIETDRVLVLVTSMGQRANARLTRAYVDAAKYDYRIGDPLKLAHTVLGDDSVLRFEREMIPQYTFVFADAIAAQGAALRFQRWMGLNPCILGSAETNGDRVTVAIEIRGDVEDLAVGDRQVRLENLQIEKFPIDDHHSGRHDARGVLLVFNDRGDELFSRAKFPQSFSYLRYAQELRRYLGLVQAEQHVAEAVVA